MENKTNIEWTDYTWNIARGCTKVDEDCKFCYMYRDGQKFGYSAREVLRTKTVFDKPLKIKEPSKIFTSSLTDVFHPAIDPYRQEMWDIIKQCPRHTFQILTKRPELIRQNLPSDWGTNGYSNVWLGVSAGHQKGLLKRLPHFLGIPAYVKFISFEPLWERVDFNIDLIDLMTIDWAVIGGESGNETGKYQYRPCKIEWIEELIQDLTPTTSIFVKQLGTHLSNELNLSDRHGRNIEEFPESVRIREFPI